jgi:peptidoglycan/LPS O-acetylase OafA/YrhL
LPPANAPAAARFYLPHLDGLRFVAFLLVFLHHLPQAPAGPMGDALRIVQAWGWSGVELFFALSAFLVTALLLKEHAATGRMSIWRFYVRRALRIWPLYFFALLLGFAILPALDWPPLAWGELVDRFLPAFVVFLGNIATAVHSYPPGYVLNLLWSVSAEEQFYLVLPLVALVLARAPLRAWIAVLAATSLVGLALRAAALHAHWPHPAIWVLQALRPDAFLAGILVAVLHVRGTLTRLVPSRAIALVLTIAGALAIASITPFPNLHTGSWHALWQYPMLAAGAGLLLAALAGPHAPRRLAGWLGSRPLAWLGKISFGLYVYHYLCVRSVMATLEAWPVVAPVAWTGWIVHAVAALTCVIAVAALSYRLLERPFLELKARYEWIRSRPA